MIYELSLNYHKPIAWMLVAAMYLELAVPLCAFGEKPVRVFAERPTVRGYDTAGEGISPADLIGRREISAVAVRHEAPASAGRREIPTGVTRPTPKIGGPGQPEMQSFQSVNGNNMVDLFSGDFSYNIPLLDVGGYPVNIHYTSGISMDQEASWVGLGWNINPGTVSRSMRGIPDDFNGTDSLARTQHVKPNKTAGVTVGGDVELIGLPLNVGASLGVFYNNYNGWGLENGINASINSGSHSYGSLSAGLALTNNSQTGLSVSPNLSVSLGAQDQQINGRATLSTNYNTRTGISALQLRTEVRANNEFTREISDAFHAQVGGGVPLTSAISFAVPSYTPTISMPYTSTQYAFTVKVGGELWGLHPSAYINGYVSKQEIKPGDSRQSLPAFGYLYYSLANNNPNALLDLNREKETQFNYNSSPMIAIPQYTYDIYSISGEGTGGMFRPYRGEIGYVHDHALHTKSNSANASIDLGFGGGFHIGADFSPTVATTQNNGWENSSPGAINNYLRFQKSDSVFQEVYFRNPGEKTSNTQAYYHSIGDDTLMRIKLGGDNSNITALNAFTLMKNSRIVGEIPVNTPLVKSQRDKKTQVITYLTAQETALYGLDKTIKSYKENTIPLGNCSDTVTILPRVDALHKKHHISEIDVTNGDGKRYVYGLPAYNVQQKDVTFSVNKETVPTNIANGLVKYDTASLFYSGDNSTGNNKGKDNYFTQDSLPAYAHSFLLTGILSPDYVDVTGDGITQDDIGDAVKFNYSRIYGPDNNYFDWRTPFQQGKANYNEGLKTYSRDDKGTYLYGKKEVWYLNSVESKTMIAVFRTKNDRQDAKAVLGANGGYNNSKGLRRLDEIDLYTKADLIRNGPGAKPIKAVHFVYSYRLCQGIDPANPGQAKLTLDSIWFSYNGNFKGRINPYVIRYSPDANGAPQALYNPSYNPKNYDRWGNFKDPSSNPGGLSNVEYPFAVQDSTKAALGAAAWQLTDIQLPSGGKLKISYESDDYAYVQNKRASQLFQVAGFGGSPGSTPGNSIYTSDKSDNYYLFVNTPVPVTDTADLRRKFLGNNDTLYFKVAVQMPADQWGGGYELVSGYGVVASLGITAGNSSQFWIRFQAVNGESPITRAALQFLRLNLPSKAYPGSEVGDNLDLSAAVTMLASSFREIANAVNGFDAQAMKKGSCQQADLSRSFIRLTNPFYKKYGGGSRVKRIELFDNWNKMTGQRESSYGQEYAYTTTQEVNGQPQTISSGVASYEPMIGNEENPFRNPIAYAEKLAPLAPVSYLFVETPICESFFPSASVGYSRVVVRTINKKAKSANGWSVTGFYTTKDFPTLVDYTVLDDLSKKRYNPKLSALLRINVKNYITLSQGYKIELNDMNGKMRSEENFPETDSLHALKASYYFYRTDNPNSYQQHLNNTVPVVDSLNGHVNPNGLIGKDIEVMTDLREQVSKTIAKDFSPNVDFIPLAFFVLPLPSVIPLPQVEQTRFRSASTVKVIQRYGILDSIIVIDKGSTVTTKNLVYDGETGNVIVSRTNNEFNDPVYTMDYPAYWAYSGMGMGYKNIGAVFYNKNIMGVNGKLFNAADRSDFPASRYFESGDELWIHTNGIPADPGCAIVAPSKTGVSKKVWVINAAKGKENHRGLYLIDSAAVPYTGMIDSLKVIRSGRRNMLVASAGGITSLANPLLQVTPGNFRIVIDSNTQVVNTKATAFKDLWKIENVLYSKDTVIQVYKNYPTLTLQPQVDLFRLDVDGSGNIKERSFLVNSPNIATSFDYVPPRGCAHSRDLYTKSVLSFDLSSIPANAIITAASVSLSPKVPKDLWVRKTVGGGFLCPKTYSTDWSRTNNFARGATSVALKRITAAWNTNTLYENFQVTTTNQALIDSNTFSAVNCTALLQDVVSNPRYGLMLELVKFNATNNVIHKTGQGNYETDFLDFCAGNQANVNNVNNSNCFPSFTAAALSVSALSTTALSTAAQPAVSKNPNHLPCDCFVPQLQVTYRALTDTTIQVCRQNIVDSATNPYRWGILGNWRTDRAYNYYNDRKESDASVTQTNIRREGVIKGFVPYWKFTDSGMLAQQDTSRWVWNSAISLYNRKGFEIEEYDPLGRYNNGFYGFNETLPVAIGRNGKYRETLYEGFEDYGYKSQNCVVCASPREFDFTAGNTNVTVSNVQSHTGLYSLKINAGTQSKLTVPVVSAATDSLAAALSVKIDSTPILSTTVIGKGKGVSGLYAGNFIVNFRPCGTPLRSTRLDTTINFQWGLTPPFPTICANRYTVTWTGFIQAPATDLYYFYGTTDYQVSMSVNNIAIKPAGPSGYGTPLSLVAGQLYPVTVQYTHYSLSGTTPSRVSVSWWRIQDPTLRVIPKAYLYPPGIVKADTAGSVITTVKKWCVKANYVKQSNSIRPVFSPLQGDHQVISAWVRIDAPDCNTLPALSNVVNVTFNTGTNAVTLQKTGVRIEGWQRYESEVFVPANAVSLSISLTAPAANNIYMDDIRMTPFNSNGKSYVYNPINLREMAELDENNYATFFEYDDDGTLIRVKKETEKGIQTMKETRSGTIKDN